MRVKEGSEKAGLKLKIKKTKITASNPITSWQIEVEKLEVVTEFPFLGSKICEFRLQPWNQKMIAFQQWNYDKPRQCVKIRDIISLTKFCVVKAMVFPVVMYGLEKWTLKKAEHQRIDVFELWWWRRLLRVPWIASRLNQSILREIKADSSLKGLLLMLKLQYFGHLVWTEDSWEKSLMLVKIKAWRRRGHQRMRWLDSITNTMNMNNLVQTPGDGEGQGGLACCSPWGWEKSGMTG